MNANTQQTNERKQPNTNDEQKRREEETYWAEWWREYAQTWR